VNRTKIEWVQNPDGSQGYTHNPMSGCENHTPEGLCLDGLFPCYAYKLAYRRLKQRYLANRNGLPYSILERSLAAQLRAEGNPFYPRFWEGRLLKLRGEGDYDKAYPARNAYHASREKGKGIFVCDMGDLFGVGIPEQWTRRVLEQCEIFSQHRFYLLTKQPQNLIKFSPFPENCWVGVTATNGKMVDDAGYYLEKIEASVKYISLEPLLESMLLFFGKPTIAWLIIGACTGSWVDMANLCLRYGQLTLTRWGNKWTAQPRIEWLREIVGAADKAGIPVFLKDNLLELVNYHSPQTDFAFNKDGCYRQEMPGEVKH